MLFCYVGLLPVAPSSERIARRNQTIAVDQAIVSTTFGLGDTGSYCAINNTPLAGALKLQIIV